MRLSLPIHIDAPFDWLAKRWGIYRRPRTWRDNVVDWCATVMLGSLSLLGWIAIFVLGKDLL